MEPAAGGAATFGESQEIGGMGASAEAAGVVDGGDNVRLILGLMVASRGQFVVTGTGRTIAIEDHPLPGGGVSGLGVERGDKGQGGEVRFYQVAIRRSCARVAVEVQGVEEGRNSDRRGRCFSLCSTRRSSLLAPRF